MTTPRFFRNPSEFRKWLEKNHASETEFLVGFWKVGTGKPSMTWSESVDEALCFGWIDGVTKRIDDDAYQIRFTPRKRGSIWSKVNIDKVERLREAGRMKPEGEKAFAGRTQAKSAIYAYEQKELPELSASELRAFKKNKLAWKFFESTPPGYRKTLIHWITTAKKPQTRALRLAKLMEASARGERLL